MTKQCLSTEKNHTVCYKKHTECTLDGKTTQVNFLKMGRYLNYPSEILPPLISTNLGFRIRWFPQHFPICKYLNWFQIPLLAILEFPCPHLGTIHILCEQILGRFCGSPHLPPAPNHVLQGFCNLEWGGGSCKVRVKNLGEGARSNLGEGARSKSGPKSASPPPPPKSAYVIYEQYLAKVIAMP